MILHRSLSALLAGGFVPVVFAQTALPVRVRGTIDSVDAQTMTVTSRDGQKIALAIAPDVLVTAIIAANITDIKPGSYIGTAAVPQADGVRAFEIQVCPDSMRGVGEGPSLGPPQSTMTNGAVGDVVVTQGRTLTLRYEDGEKTVVVPENAPIISYGVGSRAMLVSGARHHYGNTEAGRLSDATTRRHRTERADTADVTATPPSARQEHFASDVRSRWSGPGGHGRGVPSMSSACGAAVLRLCLQPPAADWHKDTAKGLLS